MASPERTSDAALRRSVAIALGIHAAAIAGLALLHAPRRAAPAAPRGEASIEIALDDEGTAGHEPSAPERRAAPAKGTRGRAEAAAEGPRVASAAETGRAAADRDEGAGESAPAPPSAEPAPPSSGSTAPIELGRPDLHLGLGGGTPFLAGASAADAGAPGGDARGREPTEAERVAQAERRVEQSLRQAAHEHDRTLGLGPEGPVLTALDQATTASTAPIRGRAVFLAIANGAGEVVGIEVLDCDGGRSGWAQAASIAFGSLKGKKLRMPGGASRAEMKIEVTSAWKLPSGQDPGAAVDIGGIPVSKGEGKDATKVSILDPIPKVSMQPVDENHPIPVPQVTMNLLGTNADPANIGAAARRIVHAHLVDSKIL